MQTKTGHTRGHTTTAATTATPSTTPTIPTGKGTSTRGRTTGAGNLGGKQTRIRQHHLGIGAILGLGGDIYALRGGDQKSVIGGDIASC